MALRPPSCALVARPSFPDTHCLVVTLLKAAPTAQRSSSGCSWLGHPTVRGGGRGLASCRRLSARGAAQRPMGCPCGRCRRRLPEGRPLSYSCSPTPIGSNGSQLSCMSGWAPRDSVLGTTLCARAQRARVSIGFIKCLNRAVEREQKKQTMLPVWYGGCYTGILVSVTAR